MSKIYLISNTNNDTYIGHTNQELVSKLAEHFKIKELNSKKILPLYKKINELGEDVWEILLMEECKFEDRYIREQIWIDRIKPNLNINIEIIPKVNSTPVATTPKNKEFHCKECDVYMWTNSKSKHLRSKIHAKNVLENLKKNNEDNEDNETNSNE